MSRHNVEDRPQDPGNGAGIAAIGIGVGVEDPDVAGSSDDLFQDPLVAGVWVVVSRPMNNDVGDADRFIDLSQFGELCG